VPCNGAVPVADRPAGHGRRLPRQRVRAVRRPLQGGIRRGRGPRLPSFCWTTATRRRPSPCRGASPSQPPPPTGPGRGGSSHRDWHWKHLTWSPEIVPGGREACSLGPANHVSGFWYWYAPWTRP